MIARSIGVYQGIHNVSKKLDRLVTFSHLMNQNQNGPRSHGDGSSMISFLSCAETDDKTKVAGGFASGSTRDNTLTSTHHRSH